MKREIKFRAWDLKRKIMHQVSDLTFRKDWIGCNALHIEKNKIGDTIGINYFDKRHEDSFVLMQFTGLHDKNGREIYEGDVIKRHYDTYQVVWMYSGWRLTKIKNHYMEEFYDCSHFSFTDDEFKIIGNIYENPELL